MRITKKRSLIVLVLLISALLYLIFGYLQLGKPTLEPGDEVIVSDSGLGVESPQASQEPNPLQLETELEVFAKGLEIPWSIVWTSPDRMLVTERKGRIIVIENEKSQPLHVFSEVSSRSEEGLMGMTLDPNYDENKLLYVCLAYEKNEGLADKVVKLKDLGDSLQEEQVILDDIPAARFHAGCRIRFGPDQKLYITTGDATNKEIAQDLNNLGGKILRINSDGSIPADNPFPNSPVYSYGHRNAQGIDWHPSGTLWSSEHGPSGFDGPGGGDEVNLIEAGKNYGWPLVSHENNQPGLQAPKLVFTPAEAPASGVFYTSEVIPQYTNNFFFTALKGEGIIRVVVDEQGENVISFEKLKGVDVGRIRDVALGPDGFLYFSTSNKDGRGKLRAGDDKIYRIRTTN